MLPESAQLLRKIIQAHDNNDMDLFWIAISGIPIETLEMYLSLPCGARDRIKFNKDITSEICWQQMSGVKPSMPMPTVESLFLL